MPNWHLFAFVHTRASTFDVQQRRLRNWQGLWQTAQWQSLSMVSAVRHDAGVLRFKAKLHQRPNRRQAVSFLTGLPSHASVAVFQKVNWQVVAPSVVLVRLFHD